MKFLLCSALLVGFALSTNSQADDKTPPVLDFKMKSLSGKDVDLAKYKGKVLLVVNTASQCGATPQYEQLQGLFESYGPKGLEVIGVPCNQFGSQEPGSASDIKEFCTDNYNVTFDMLAKVDVNGENATPLYQYLTSKETNPESPGPVKWNFEKFLIGKDGKIIARFRTGVKPDDPKVVSAIESALK
ncbi:MAG: glutathione peroxidase [Planctomycetaceae bacterium]|jgi:glutathione peroxidase|nr:glutathione peroxidase [bacterium]MDC0274114.1 glutathione peroxidase [Planctomycetaceae bacterium]MDG2388092.1 glutathione peroxidase [Planctomycetaceae bacterium]